MLPKLLRHLKHQGEDEQDRVERGLKKTEKNVGQKGPPAKVIITDPEFHDLVHGEDVVTNSITSSLDTAPSRPEKEIGIRNSLSISRSMSEG